MGGRSSFLSRVPAFIGFTVSGCCANVYTFEKLIQQNSEITTFITFSQYLFIFICASLYLRYTSFWTKKKEAEELAARKGKSANPSSGLSYEFVVPVLSQVLTGYLGNLVFQFDLSMPSHIIFRSSGTAMTLLLGWAFWGKRYGIEKIVGSSLIAVGTIIFTLDVKSVSDGETAADAGAGGSTRVIGIVILLATTVISSLTSLFKEQWYQHGSKKLEWREVLYYNYLYGTVIYVLLIPQVVSEFHKLQLQLAAGAGAPETPGTSFTLVTFVLNWITQLCCILGVNVLVFRISALSLTIVLLVRRFLSLMLSIYVFDNPVSLLGHVGVLCVFAGATIYSFGSKIRQTTRGRETRDVGEKKDKKRR